MSYIKSNNTRRVVSITTLIITVTLILDRLLPEGMFLDGITYAAISRNLAMGKGSFWSLYYRNEWVFSEHPPLMFGIQALFFKMLGNHYLTEKIYCFAIWLLTAILLKNVWNKTIPDREEKYSYALPLLLWCIIPTVTWGYTSNILDTTMALFDLAAAWVLYRLLSSGTGNNRLLLLIIAGLLTFCALLTKGPVGAFPLAIPAIYWLMFQPGKQLAKVILYTIILAATIAACYFILWQFPEPRANFTRYLNEQLVAALSGNREITGGGLGRLSLLVELCIQMLPPVIITILIVVAAKLLKLTPAGQGADKRKALFFLLVGIAASLPIMLSVKQRSFYLIPSLPFYILALCIWVRPYYIALTNRLQVSNTGSRYFNIAALVVGLGLCIYLGSKIGQVGRDKEIIANMHLLAEKFPEGQVLGICAESEKDYAFLAYLERYNKMEVSPIFYAADYVLVDKNVCNNDIIPIISKIGFAELPEGTGQYVIYRKHFPLRFDFTLLNPAFRTGGR